MANFDLVATLRANVSDFTRGMKDARDQINDLSKQSERLEKMGKAFTNTGKKMTAGLTLPLVGMATMAVRTGMQYETSMSKVQAISGATGDDMAKLEAVAREMGATTRYSASEAADGLSYMALAGWNTEQMVSALPSVLNLATAGQLDLATASDIVTDMMSMFGIEAADASKATDIFASAQSNSNTNVQQLSEALKMAGPAAASASQSLEDTSAVLGILADNGIKGSAAGTAVNSMFMDLQKSAEDGAVSIGDASVAVYDAEGNMRSIVDIIKDVESATEGMSDEQRNAALQSVFQQRSLRGVNTLLNAGTDSLFSLQNELYNSSGAAQDMANTMDDNMQGSLLALKSAVEEVAIQFFELGNGPLRGLIDWLTQTVRKFGEMDDSTKQTIIIIGGIVAAIGPLLIILGTVISLVGKVTGAISTMSQFLFGTTKKVGLLAKAFAFLTSPIGLVILAIAAIVGVIIYLWNTNEEFRAAVIDIWNGIKEGIQTAWEALSAYLQPAVQAVVDFVKDIFGGLVEWWKENNEMILQAAQNVWNVVSSVIEVALGVIMAVMQKVWPFVEKLVFFTWNAIKDVIQGAIKVITGIIEFFSALFTGNWSALWESIKNIVSGAVQLVWGLVKLWFVTKIIALAKALLVGLKTIVTTIWTTIKSIFTGGLQFIFGKVSSVFSSISGIIKTVMGSIRDTISSILNAIKTVFSNILINIVSSVTGGFSKVATAFSKGMSSALRTVTGFVTKFFKAGANIVGNIAKGITSAVGKVTGAIGGVLGKARDLLPFSPPKDKSSPLVDIHKNGIIEQIAKGVYDDEGSLKKAMNSALGVASGEVGNFSGDLNNALRNSISGGYSVNASGELSVKQQPAYFNLNIGGQNFTAFVENILDEGDRQLHLNTI